MNTDGKDDIRVLYLALTIIYEPLENNPPVLSVCGDGKKEGSEECDDGNSR